MQARVDEILAKDRTSAEREERRIQKHLNTKLPMTLESFRNLFDDWTDNQKMEIIKSLIWTSGESFYYKVLKELNSKRFSESID